ncbi:MAG: OmpA family protein [Octadecabacter sp.]|nr:OmpA family protein [Octadecabacter sp.]
MRKFIGVLVLAAGVGFLGLYGSANDAERVQAAILAGADRVTATARHGVQARVGGRDIIVTGMADTQAEFDSLEAAFDAVDGRRVVDMAGVVVLPVARPFELMATRAHGMTTLAGVVPDEASRAVLAGLSDAGELVLSSGVPDANWPDMAARAVAVLNGTVSGDMTLSNRALTLRALVPTPTEAEAARGALAHLPDGYTLDAAFDVLDDGTPLRLTATLDPDGLSASGKVPAGYALAAELPDGTLALTEAGVPLGDADWPLAANTGLAALAVLHDGTLTFENRSLTLAGSALPDGKARAEAMMGGLPEGYTGLTDIALYDDGSPPDWQFTYTATSGGGLVGKLPSDLTSSMLADTTGLRDLTGAPAVSLNQIDGTGALGILAVAAEYLPESESLRFAASPDGASLDLVLSPGVNADLVAVDLAERLPASVAFTISPLDSLPADGDVRTNPVTGTLEQFRFGNMLPVLTFAPDTATCAVEANAVLAGGGVNFLTGSAELDAKSIRAINALSSIAQRCAGEAGLTLEIAGHTDDTGNEADNQLLSESRANAVRDALIARGLDAQSIMATGYGQTRPLADNETPEGLAANRRIEFIWSD